MLFLFMQFNIAYFYAKIKTFDILTFTSFIHTADTSDIYILLENIKKIDKGFELNLYVLSRSLTFYDIFTGL